MAGDWIDTQLSGIAARTERAFAMGPFGSNIKAENYRESGVPVIRGSNLGEIGEAAFKGSDFVFLTEEKADQLASANAYANDIVFVAQGTIGKVGIIPSNTPYHRFILSQNLMKVTVDPNRADPRFVFYFFRSSLGQHEIMSRVNPTGVPCISKPLTSLRQFGVRIPTDVNEQRAISHILGTLDDKIELNRRMNETLEATARAMFKSWFVDFDPVRAKADGRDPGLPKHIADLFPDSFEESELGEIPTGWTPVPLEDMAQIHGGKQLPTADCQRRGTYPVFGANGIMGYAHRATHGAFVVAFGRVGAYCGSIHWTYRGAWINNNASSVSPKSHPEYVLQVMLNIDFQRMRTGSAQPFIPNSALAASPVLRATDTILDAYCSAAYSFRLRQCGLAEESNTLSELRDTLLPKLISGELRVKEAERVLSRTA